MSATSSISSNSNQRLWPATDHPAILHRLSDPVGIDLEWEDDRITWFAAADRNHLVAQPYEEWMRDWTRQRRKIVGHNVIMADAVMLGLERNPELYEDTIIAQWVLNSHLCRSAAGDDDDDGGHRYMGLWTAASLYTEIPNWKECAGKWCAGRPCPAHDIRWYNALDAWVPLLIWEVQEKHLEVSRLTDLYRFHKRLAFALAAVIERGVGVDLDFYREIEERMNARKREIESLLGFNPRSPKQVVAALATRGIKARSVQEADIEKLLERFPGDSLLESLLAYKQLGAGLSRWYGPGYVGRDGRIHPRLGIFTSTGRLQCSKPNLQNIARRRGTLFEGKPIGWLARRVVVPAPGNILISADFSNAENRVMLHLAGAEMPPRDVDMHLWLAHSIGLRENDPICRLLGGPREAAKSIVHASNYGEGISLLDPRELSNPRIVAERRAGLREVHEDWTFCGLVVSFTGINLARRIFGNASAGSRRRALQITARYFSRFPEIRRLQRRILEEAESGEVRTPDGYCLRLYGDPTERAKTALAFFGSNPVAHATKQALIAAEESGFPVRPVLQIHDEILFEAPESMSPEEIVTFVRDVMERPVANGLVLPTKVKAGKNWAEMEKIG